jgi:hypothetical protein
MTLERLGVWIVAALAWLGVAAIYGGLSRPGSVLGLLALGAVAALPLAVVFGRLLLSFRPAKRGWR